MKNLIKKYRVLILIYCIMLIVFPAPVIGVSIVLFAFPISYWIWNRLGFGDCTSNDDL